MGTETENSMSRGMGHTQIKNSVSGKGNSSTCRSNHDFGVAEFGGQWRDLEMRLGRKVGEPKCDRKQLQGFKLITDTALECYL